jgi:hypothetical protein
MEKSEKLLDRMSKMYDDATKKFNHINIKVIANTKNILGPMMLF